MCLVLLFSGHAVAQETNSHVDVFMGSELHYKDIVLDKVYEVLVNLTPGVKWYLPNDWQIASQVIVPIYNDYGARYKKVRLNMAVLSKELNFGNQFFKVSGGLFGQERYGVDVKWIYPITNWLALDAQVGVTGFCSMAVDWECSRMERVTGWMGARFYLGKSNTEILVRGGRYIYTDYGVSGECLKHFNHCSVGVYAQYSDIGKENAGFKVVMMIPPYKRASHKVNLRPASNFRLTYNYQADSYSMKMYTTDPEENERDGHFNKEKMKWGNQQVDFKKKGGAL